MSAHPISEFPSARTILLKPLHSCNVHLNRDKHYRKMATVICFTDIFHYNKKQDCLSRVVMVRAGLTQWGARGTLKGRPCIMSHGPTARPYHSYPSPSPSSRTSRTNSYIRACIDCLGQGFSNFFESGIGRWFMMLFVDHQLEMLNFSW